MVDEEADIDIHMRVNNMILLSIPFSFTYLLVHSSWLPIDLLCSPLPSALLSKSMEVDREDLDNPFYVRTIHDLERVIYFILSLGMSRETLLNCRPPFVLNRVQVQGSSIHGRGVFATRRIREGELVTLYPGDYLRYFPRGCTRKRTRYRYTVGDHLFKYRWSHDFEDAKKRKQLERYAFNVNSHYDIIGAPLLADDPSFLGHMCNDGAKSSKPRDRLIYERISQLRMNAVCVPVMDACVAVVACRDIGEGEEVLLSYGYEYWSCYHDKP